MATVKFSTRSKSQQSKIYVRFAISKQQDYKIVTPLLINPKYFSNKTGKVKRIAEFTQKDAFQKKLDELHKTIIDNYNDTLGTGVDINSLWLKNQVNDFFKLVKDDDLSYLVNYYEYYLKKIKAKPNAKTGRIGIGKRTYQKRELVKRKIEALQKHTSKKYKIKDVDESFRNEFINYLKNHENLSSNTIGGYTKIIKMVCSDAKALGYEVSLGLNKIKGWSVKAKHTYLSLMELEMIKSIELDSPALEKARDWLLIGCYTGQRAGDFLRFDKSQIVYELKDSKKTKFIRLTQEKTNLTIRVLVHREVEKILNKWDGFPPAYSKNIDSALAVFNRDIKRVCKAAGLTEIIEGTKKGKSKRNESGMYPKYELIQSHTCRRSFATNFYGKMKMETLRAITGHSSERQLLEYICKAPTEYAEELTKDWGVLEDWGEVEAVSNEKASLKIAQ